MLKLTVESLAGLDISVLERIRSSTAVTNLAASCLGSAGSRGHLGRNSADCGAHRHAARDNCYLVEIHIDADDQC